MEAVSNQFLEFHPNHGTNISLNHSGTQATRIESFANGVCFSKYPLKPGEIFLIEIEEKELGWCGHLRIGLTARDPKSLEVIPEYSIPDLMALGDSWVFAITRNHNKVIEEAEVPEAGEGGLGVGQRLGRREEEDAFQEDEDNNKKPKTFFTDTHLYIDTVRIPRDKLVGRSRPGRFSHILDDLYKTNALPPTARRSRIGVLYVPKSRDTADMHIVINGEDMGASAKGIPSTRPLYAVVDVFAATKCVRIVQVEYGFSSLQTLCRKTIQKHIVHRMAIDWLQLPEALKHYCNFLCCPTLTSSGSPDERSGRSSTFKWPSGADVTYHNRKRRHQKGDTQIASVVLLQQLKMSFCRFLGGEIYKDHFKPGIYVCSKCNHPLFSSRSKFPHSTPWPAFTDTIREDSVTKMMETLTAFKVLCGKCGNGLGHEFVNDGPEEGTSRF
ncbi:hypothetical protein XENORESO_004883 [Xenotaenia resolanae]|uniref:L-methionine (R)-S-oxide reductase n=1 Tax=Xenotaenia resolanae TaxID=208358 RepID=A0ABV0X7C4_9TELE